jgi:hypothetical protein|tara:strand:+ start:316 stop:423 length:108 start_codon:yes stop_codon:yes gene_type:complete
MAIPLSLDKTVLESPAFAQYISLGVMSTVVAVHPA